MDSYPKLKQRFDDTARRVAMVIEQKEPVLPEDRAVLYHFIAFICWTEYRNLRDERSQLGRRAIHNFLTARGYDDVEVDEFLAFYEKRWGSEPRGKGEKGWWKEGPSINWMRSTKRTAIDRGYSFEHVESGLYQCEMKDSTQLVKAFNHISKREQKERNRSGRTNEQIELDIQSMVYKEFRDGSGKFGLKPLSEYDFHLSPIIRTTAMKLTANLLCETCGCSYLWGGRESAPTDRIKACAESHRLLIDRLERAAKGELLKQGSVIETPTDFLERALVTHTNQTFSASKLKWMFYPYLRTPSSSRVVIVKAPSKHLRRLNDDEREKFQEEQRNADAGWEETHGEGSALNRNRPKTVELVVEECRASSLTDELGDPEEQGTLELLEDNTCAEHFEDLMFLVRVLTEKNEWIWINAKNVGETRYRNLPTEVALLSDEMLAEPHAIPETFSVNVRVCDHYHIWLGQSRTCPREGCGGKYRRPTKNTRDHYRPSFAYVAPEDLSVEPKWEAAITDANKSLMLGNQ